VADGPDFRFGELQYGREPAALDPPGHQPEPDLDQTHFAIGRVRKFGASAAVATAIVADHLSLNVVHLNDDWPPIPEFPDELTPSLRRSQEGLRSGWDDMPAERRCCVGASRFERRKSICRQALKTIGQALDRMLRISAAIPSWQLQAAHGVHPSMITPRTPMRRRSMPRRRQSAETIRPLDPADDLVRRRRSAVAAN